MTTKIIKLNPMKYPTNDITERIQIPFASAIYPLNGVKTFNPNTWKMMVLLMVVWEYPKTVWSGSAKIEKRVKMPSDAHARMEKAKAKTCNLNAPSLLYSVLSRSLKNGIVFYLCLVFV